MKKLGFILLLLISFMLTAPVLSDNQVHAQCAMCKSNAENAVKSKNKKAGLGINNGILILLSMPYVAFGIIGVLWYRNSKSQKKKRLMLSNE